MNWGSHATGQPRGLSFSVAELTAEESTSMTSRHKVSSSCAGHTLAGRPARLQTSPSSHTDLMVTGPKGRSYLSICPVWACKEKDTSLYLREKCRKSRSLIIHANLKALGLVLFRLDVVSVKIFIFLSSTTVSDF